MKINTKKTKIIPLNPTKKFDFLPLLNFPGEDPLEVINSTKPTIFLGMNKTQSKLQRNSGYLLGSKHLEDPLTNYSKYTRHE